MFVSHRLSLIVIAAGLAGSVSTTHAAGPGAVHLDDSGLEAYLYTFEHGDKGSHYVFKVAVAVWADSKLGEHDAVKIDWKQKGKVLGTARCNLVRDGKHDNLGVVLCEYGRDDKPALTAFGDIDAELTFIDDDHDRSAPLRTLHLRVARYWDWTGMDGKRPHHEPHFQVVGDELLGSSLLYLADDPNDGSNDYGPVAFEFWTAQRSHDWSKSTFRCSVDGKQIDKELTAGSEWLNYASEDHLTEKNRVYGKGPSDVTNDKYQWSQFLAQPNLRHRSKLWKKGSESSLPSYTVAIEDHPGAWVCQVRKEGKVEREFHFTVNPDGTVPLSPEQQGDGALYFPQDQYRVVQTVFPRPNDIDFSFQPAAIKKSGFFGRPWAHPDAMKDMFGALPPAVGASEVKAPAGAK